MAYTEDLRNALGHTFDITPNTSGSSRLVLETRAADQVIRVAISEEDGTEVYVFATHPTAGHVTQHLYSCEFSSATPISVIVGMVQCAVRAARTARRERTKRATV